MLKKESSRPALPVAGYIILQLCVGVFNLWSVFQLPVCELFGWEYGSVVLVASFFMVAFVTGSFVQGLLASRLHPRLVCLVGALLFSGGYLLSSCLKGGSVWNIYLSYGIVSGLGCGMINNASIFGIINWMPNRRGTASGIAGVCFNISGIYLGTMFQSVIRSSGVLATWRLWGLVGLVIMLLACTLISRPSAEFSARFPRVAPTEGLSLGQAAKDGRFWLLMMFTFLATGCWNVIVPLIKPLALLRGLNESAAAMTVAMVSVFAIIGKLLGPLADRFGRNAILILTACSSAIGSALLIFATGPLYMVGIWLPALSFSAGGLVIPVLSADFFGPKNAGLIYGGTFYGSAASSLILNSIATKINAAGAQTGNYTASFIMCICISLSSLVVLFLMNRITKKKNAAKCGA